MKLKIKNIGKIIEADINIDGMTIIAGENNTGKSTVGKALFSSFNSLYNLDQTVINHRENDMLNQVNDFIYENISSENSFGSKLSISRNITKEVSDFIKTDYQEKDLFLEENIYDLIQKIKEIFNEKYTGDIDLIDIEAIEKLKYNLNETFNITDEEIILKIFSGNLQTEFANQINNFNTIKPAEIELIIKDSPVKIQINDNLVTMVKDPKVFRTQAIYIDDPFILDDIIIRRSQRISSLKSINHREHLKSKIVENHNEDFIEEIKAEKKLENIFAKINSIVDGDLSFKKFNNISYKKRNSEEEINIENVSSGMKTFLVIKELLLKGVLEQSGTLILDEPEIHLHPQWQIILAELIVLIQKEFNMHILLTTHSPYFLYAIEIFTKKHNILEKTNYYLAENTHEKINFHKVNDNIEKIYSKLAKPFQTLENMKYEGE